MATHSSILAWEIPEMEGVKFGGLQSMGSQKSRPQVMEKNNSLTAPGATSVDK